MPVKSIILNKNKHLTILLLLNTLLFLSSDMLNAETIRLAVASNFLKPAQQLAQAFEAESLHNVQISSGSSGKLYLQISHGAPFDLFLSADEQKPQLLIKQGLAVSSSLKTYAVGKLLLWFKYDKENCNQAIPSNLLSLLSKANIHKIATANPKLAPYGLASQQLLNKQNLWSILKSKVIMSENISQVAQLVKIGVVDAALISASHKSQLQNIKHSCILNIPRNDYPPIEQQLVILSKSKKKSIAQEFVIFMQSQKAQNLIKNMGYYLPNSDKIPPS